MPVDVRRIPADSPDALALVAAMMDELLALYGPANNRNAPGATPEELSPPGGGYVAVYEDGVPVAGGGVKRLDAETGEIKRMLVVPEARGRGLSRILLEGIEAAARDLGYAHVRLDTGPDQPRALALYRSAGYVDIENYNANDYATYWGEKKLR